MSLTEEIEGVRQSILDFRRRGQYLEAHKYISNLNQSTCEIAAVAVEIASLYVTQGHYIRAWDACRLPKSCIFTDEDEQSFTSEVCQVDSVCLALTSAYIGISRHGRIKTALRIAEQVHESWLSPHRKCECHF